MTITTNSFSYLRSRSGRMGKEKKRVALRCPTLGKCRTSPRNKLEFWGNKTQIIAERVILDGKEKANRYRIASYRYNGRKKTLKTFPRKAWEWEKIFQKKMDSIISGFIYILTYRYRHHRIDYRNLSSSICADRNYFLFYFPQLRRYLAALGSRHL